MAINWSDIRSQLAPSWTPVNIGILVVLFLISTLLGLIWLGYILGGRHLGLDFSQSDSIKQTGQKIKRSFRAAIASFKDDSDSVTETRDTQFSGNGGKPAHDPTTSHDSRERSDMDTLAEARAALAREKAAFEAEKAAYKNKTDTVD